MNDRAGRTDEAGPVIVSACLLGVRCRYDGAHSEDRPLRESLRDLPAVAICPEELGGLPTPRPAAQLIDGEGDDVWSGSARVVRVHDGEDVTKEFKRGAHRVLEAALESSAQRAILKEGSPSCGSSHVMREGIRVRGRGVTTALLLENGVVVEAAG
ncbi:MAG: hypothetical protein CME06_08675 [Gemmatimonadetes bacterium]|nr:hypothetical protein [Gemmatimonadota bacterium]